MAKSRAQGWAATSSKYPLALPALTVDAEEAGMHADGFCCVGGRNHCLGCSQQHWPFSNVFPRGGAG